jgi:hypothetical protein
MSVWILLTVLSPFTALLPVFYAAYRVLSKKESINKNPWNTGLIALFIWSFFVGLINRSYLSTIASFAFFLYFCLSVFMQNHFNNEDKIERLYKCLVHFSILPAIVGIVEKIVFLFSNDTFLTKLLVVVSKATIGHRINSTFGNANLAGNWFAIILLVTLYLNSISTDKNRTFYRALSVLYMIVLCLTASRGAFIGFLMGLSVYYVLTKNKKDFRFLLMISIPILILTVMPSAPQSGNITSIAGHKLTRSIVTRDMIWSGSLKMIKLKPLTGWGLLGIVESGSKYIAYDGPIVHSHNIWISFLTFLGPLGLSIYLYMKLYLLRGIKILYSQSNRLAALMAGIQALVIGHGFVDVAFMAPQTGILFFANSALICALVVQYSLSGKLLPVAPYKSLSKTG